MFESVSAWLDSNWFALLIAVFMIGMMLYGHSRGFVRLAVSLTALFITLALAHTALPKVTDFVQRHTGLEKAVQGYVLKSTGIDALTQEQMDSREDQEQIIGGLQIPENFQRILRENNRQEIWERLGAEQFQQYVAEYLGKMIINYLGFALLFLAIWVLLHLGLRVLDVLTALPVVHGMNQIAGALLGFVESLIFVWLGFMILGLFEGSETGSKLYELVQSSAWLSFLYRYNLLAFFLRNLVNTMLF